MTTESQCSEIKERLTETKHLFQTRHYIQCATLCEGLLNRTNKEVRVPHHLLYEGV